MEPAVPCFTFPHSNPVEYFVFVKNMINNAVCVHFLQMFVSGFAFTVIEWVSATLFFFLWISITLKVIKSRFDAPFPTVLFYLISVSFIFYAFTAVGRVCLGPEAANAPRYTIYTIPVFYVMYILLEIKLKTSLWKNLIFTSLIIVLAMKEVILWQHLPEKLEEYKQLKISWKQCYIEKKSIPECNTKIGITVVLNAPFAEESLKLMEKEKIHFFK
jgi:hypothetical protein